VEGRINTLPVRPHSLSVRAGDGHLLVTSQHSRQVVQYSGDWLELGRVSLPGNVMLEHATPTSRDTFIVCGRTAPRRRSPNANSELHQVTQRTLVSSVLPFVITGAAYT